MYTACPPPEQPAMLAAFIDNGNCNRICNVISSPLHVNEDISAQSLFVNDQFCILVISGKWCSLEMPPRLILDVYFSDKFQTKKLDTPYSKLRAQSYLYTLFFL